MKSWYSNKQEIYGQKSEVSVVPSVLCINATEHEKQSIADIFILRKHISLHKVALEKSRNGVFGAGSLKDLPEYRAALVCNRISWLKTGYSSLFHLTEKHRSKSSTASERHKNDRLFHDRVVMENYFGWESTLWKFLVNKYPWHE